MNYIIKTILILLVFLGIITSSYSQELTSNFSVDSLVNMMSQSEKIDFISGYENFNIKGNKRLGIPQIKMADGPMGINGHGKATAFPASICMASTWNTNLIQEVGEAIATEAKSKGIGILLAPGVNNYRVPQCGRNFEYYGEDPFLNSQMAVSFINGVQSKHVMATIKHFVANNHDYDRHRVSSNIDERSLNEIYFPPFKAAVEKANVGAIMTSYNLVNGIHTSESPYLIKEILRDTWGFNGIIMSDWISVYSLHAFQAGLDLEMPRPQFMNHHHIDSLLKEHPQYNKLLNEKVKHIISTCQRIGLYDSLLSENKTPNWIKHQEIAKQVVREGIVLLKNENHILPLNSDLEQKILVIGPNAKYTPYSGGGAAHIDSERNITFLEGIKDIAPENYLIDYMNTEGLFHLNTNFDKNILNNELKKAKKYDAIIMCLGFNSKTEGEAFDRPFSLPEEQLFIIEKLAEINDKLIIVMNAGGGISMPWLNKTKALLHTWYAGQEGGTALGEILFGEINPSGKLPISIEKHWKDNAAFSSYDSTNAIAGTKPFYTLYGKAHETIPMEYSEGIFTGYRHYEANDIEPQFPFGFGLSYTTFDLSHLKFQSNTLGINDSIRFQFVIKNTGKIAGYETIQLYICDLEHSVSRPIKELKDFKKVYLEKGETKTIYWSVSNEVLSFYHPQLQDWIIENGEFEILLGNSSNHMILKEKIYYQK